jgi:hypothetical protein
MTSKFQEPGSEDIFSTRSLRSLVIRSSTVPARVSQRSLAIAAALVDPLWTALTMGAAAQPLDLNFHRALGGEADHLAQQIGVGALF